MPMNDMQYLAAYGDFDKDVLVSAGAGSGKTQVLTSRVANLIEKGIKPTELLVLTFTKNAAAEMKSRVRGLLEKNDELKDSISLLEQAYITTYDSFNLSMCKKYFYALNISPNIKVCDSSAMKMKKIEILGEIIDELYSIKDPLLFEFLDKFTDKKDNRLTEILLNLISSIDKMEDSIAYLNSYEENFFSQNFISHITEEYMSIILDYKDKAVAMLERLLSCTDKGKSKDGISAVIDTYLTNSYEGVKLATTMNLPVKCKSDSEDFSIIKKQYNEILKSLKDLTKYSDLQEAIDLYKSSKNTILLFIDILTKYYKRIEQYSNETGLYEFNDIQKLAIKLVRENEDIREEMKKQFKCIMIDEYQDTSDLQEAFIGYFKNDNRFMVGDIKQSIYRFRNANPNIFKDKYETYVPICKDNYPTKKEEFRDYPGYLIDMNQNFRSRKEVLDDINNIFSLLMTKEVGDADYIKSHQMRYGLTTYENMTCSDKRGFNSDFIYYPYDTKDKIDRAYYEGFVIAKDIQSKVGKYVVYNKDLKDFRKATYDDFCIILDRADHYEIFKRILEANNIPVVINADCKINDSYPSMIVVNMLKLISYHYSSTFNSDYYHALTSVLRSFIFNMSDDNLFKIISQRILDNEASKIARSLSYMVDKSGACDIFNQALKEFRVYEVIKTTADINSSLHAIEYIFTKIGEFESMGYHFTKIVDLLDELLHSSEDIKYSLDVSTSSGVKMMNIHKSKGLEYPICYFADFSHKYNEKSANNSTGFDPVYGIYTKIFDDGTDDTIVKVLFKDKWIKEITSERLRLFYVALTRAREKMIFVRSVDDFKESKETDSQKQFGEYFDYIEERMPSIIKNRIELPKTYFDQMDISKIDGRFYNINLKNNNPIEYNPINFNIQEVKIDNISKRMNKLSNSHLDKILENGINYHYILEMLDFKKPFESLNSLGLDRNTYEVISNVLNMDLLKNISLAKTLHEYEFSCIISNRAYHGIIDLLVIYDDHIDIIDYKLKNYDDEAYDRQLGLYKAYVKSKTNKPIKCHLLSIIDAKSREVEV